jgi:adenylate kinase
MKDHKKPMNFIVLGPQGCGKGTQAKLLLKYFKNLYNIASGDLYRRLSATDSDTGRRVKKIVDSGGLSYGDIATMLWMHEIAFKVKENQGILADGFPRRLGEAHNLLDFLKFLKRDKNTLIILLQISEKEAISRLAKRRICKKCGQLIPWLGRYKTITKCDKCNGELEIRTDDDANGIRKRLSWYRQSAVPALNYLKKQGLPLLKINGEQSIENVFKDVLKAIKKHTK